MEKKIYSYHTFLYPFLWNNGNGNGKSSRLQFEQELIKNNWYESNMITPKNMLKSVEDPDPWTSVKDQRLDYQTFQYFNASARKALFRGNGDVINTWLYQPDEIHEKGHYIITVKDKSYDLIINQIKLSLFNTGVGILVFELEYWIPVDLDVKKAQADIRAINEHGRRLYPEFLPYKEEGGSSPFNEELYASKLELRLGERSLVENIQEKSEAHYGADLDKIRQNSYLRDPMQQHNIIHRLLVGPNSDIHIMPAIDDRMFVCCCILDEKYSDTFLGYSAFPQEAHIDRRQQADWKFMKDWNTGKALYALINVDGENASCNNRKMLDQYLEKQLYLRWIEYGTIHAVTNHSLFCITSPKVLDSVVNPFLIEYVQLCILALAQRASLIHFDSMITDIVAGAQLEEKSIEGQMLVDLIKISEQFAIFQGEILIPEVTSQIQGIELYDKLQEMLFIQKLEQNIQTQLHNLFEIAQSNQAEQQRKHDEEMKRLESEKTEKQDKMNYKFTAFGTAISLLAIISAITDLYSLIIIFNAKDTEVNNAIFSCKIVIALLAIFIVIICFAYCLKWPKKKKPDKKYDAVGK